MANGSANSSFQLSDDTQEVGMAGTKNASRVVAEEGTRRDSLVISDAGPPVSSSTYSKNYTEQEAGMTETKNASTVADEGPPVSSSAYSKNYTEQEAGMTETKNASTVADEGPPVSSSAYSKNYTEQEAGMTETKNASTVADEGPPVSSSAYSKNYTEQEAGMTETKNASSTDSVVEEGIKSDPLVDITGTITTAASTSATSGIRWGAHTRRKYVRSSASLPKNVSALGSWLDRNPHLKPQPPREKWIVCTTIFNVTKAAMIWASLANDGWCTIIVADMKGPPSYTVAPSASTHLQCILYLTVEDQFSLGKDSSTVGRLPFNHFGRKNAGYIVAMMNGATAIYDTDDDNELLSSEKLPVLPEWDAGILVADAQAEETMNVYTLFEPSNPSIWPRGMSLEKVKQSAVSRAMPAMRGRAAGCSVQQFLANNDPDVDAIYRLTQPLPVDFGAKKGHHTCISISRGTLVPYNSQATLHHSSSFWGLLLPVTVHGRVSDIWRSYFNQPILWATGRLLAFCTAAVSQFRNAHDYMQDFQAEIPLYEKVPALLEALLNFNVSMDLPLPSSIVLLWTRMYEIGFIEVEDVELVQAWIADLTAINYSFPVASGFSSVSLPPQEEAVGPISQPQEESVGPISSPLQEEAVGPISQPQEEAAACKETASLNNFSRPLLFKGILLVVNYNSQHYQTSCFLRELWGGLFEQIVFFGSRSDTGYGILEANISSEICQEGLMNSCGRFFDDSMQAAITLFPNYSGYLFTHDDLAFNVHRMALLNRSKIWTSDDLTWTDFPQSGHPEEGTTTISSNRYFSWDALQESGCATKMSRRYPRATHDMYYVPGRFAGEFARLTKIFRSHGVESESAGPTILWCLGGGEAANENDFEKWAGTYEYQAGRENIWKRFSLNLDFLHPLKFSKNQELQKHAFSWLNQSLALLAHFYHNKKIAE